MNIEDIQKRNARVEADKAWETSWTRRLILTLGIYLVTSVYFYTLGVNTAFLHGVVPAGGYLLSTMTLPLFKRWWVNKIYKRNEASQ